MYVHYNEDTLRVTGITTFIHAETNFITPTIDILDVIVDKPLNEYIVSLVDKTITWVDKSAEIIASDLVLIKEQQKDIIRKQYNIIVEGAIDIAGVFYAGGNTSGTKLDSAKRLAEMVGQTTVIFYDVSNTANILTILEAETIISTIGLKFQTDFSKKQDLFKLIAEATTKEEVLLISW